MNLPVTKRLTFELTVILFGEIPHLVFRRAEVAGFQTWKSDAKFCIELTFQHGATILTEYDEREKWEQVTKFIVEGLLP